MNLLTVCELYELNGVRADWLNGFHLNFALSGSFPHGVSQKPLFPFCSYFPHVRKKCHNY